MRTLLFTLMSLACTVALAATVYKWVDEDGVVHYSDQPHENAQKVELKAPQTYSRSKDRAAAGRRRRSSAPRPTRSDPVSELHDLRAGERPGVPEHRHRHRRCHACSTRSAARRSPWL